MTYSRKQLVENLRIQIPQSREKMCRALMLIYDRQTEQEVLKGKTIEDNSIGFTAMDAKILTGIAIFYQRNGYISKGQFGVIRHLIPKYAGQILDSSIERGLIRQISPRRYEIVRK